MSGHSKWSTIRHKKAINDAKKGKVFSKLSTQITHNVVYVLKLVHELVDSQ
jgi:transcriptional/translational regulatory protein YebC/TACO1